MRASASRRRRGPPLRRRDRGVASASFHIERASGRSRSDFRARRGPAVEQPYPRAMRVHRIGSVLSGLVVVASVQGSSRAEDAPSASRARIVAHAITARFDPLNHALVARDVLTVEAAAKGTLALRLADGFVSRVLRQPPQPNSTLDGTGDRPLVRVVDVPAGRSEIEIAYAGVIFDGVEKKEGLAWVVGDATRGLISEKGIFLNAGSGWYPRTENDGVMRFDVTSYVPQPFQVVTQGRPPQRSTVVAPKGWTSETDVSPLGLAPGEEAGIPYAVSVAKAALPT